MANIIEISVQIHAETDKAYLASDSGEREDAKWIAKSQLEAVVDKGMSLYEFSVPEWLAMEKGWI